MNLTKIAEGLRLIADGLDDGDKKADTPREPAVQEQDKPSKKAGSKPSQPEKVAKEQQPEEVTDEPQQEEEPETKPTYTKVQVIAALQSVAKAHGRERIDKILGDFNVQRVSDLDEEDYGDVVALAEAALA